MNGFRFGREDLLGMNFNALKALKEWRVCKFAFDFEKIFLVLINIRYKFGLDFEEVFRRFTILQVACFLVDNYTYDYMVKYPRGFSWNLRFSSSSSNSSGFLSNCLFCLESFSSFRPTDFHVRYGPKIISITHAIATQPSKWMDWDGCANASGIVSRAFLEQI